MRKMRKNVKKNVMTHYFISYFQRKGCLRKDCEVYSPEWLIIFNI